MRPTRCASPSSPRATATSAATRSCASTWAPSTATWSTTRAARAPAQFARLEILEGQINDVEKRFAAFVQKDLAAANKLLAAAKAEELKVATREEWKAKDQSGGGSSVVLEDEQVQELRKLYPWLEDLGRNLLTLR